MENKRRNWLWDWMPFFYDQFYDKFPPYQELHRDILHKLNTASPPLGFVLDAGCGTGSLSVKLAKRGFSVLGIDRSSRMLNIALGKKKKEGLTNLFFRQEDLNGEIDLKDFGIRKIFFIHSLYLLTDPQKTLRELSSLLPKGGEIILCNPWRKLTPPELYEGGLFFLRTVARDRGMACFFGVLLTLLGMGLLNLIIQRQKGKKIFHCWGEKEIGELFRGSGLELQWAMPSCLAKSHLLVCGVKE